MGFIDRYLFKFYFFTGSACIIFGSGYLYIAYRIYSINN